MNARVDCWNSTCIIFLLGLATAFTSTAQTFNTLADFDVTTGGFSP